jgi:cellulose synthase/poly-beta-1,6-N-acetylglucosamine synthase-like glycosyltransferase
MAAGAEYHWFSTPVRAQLVNVVTLLTATLLNFVTSKFLVFREVPVEPSRSARRSSFWGVLRMAAYVGLPAGIMLATLGLVGVQVWLIGFILIYAMFGLVTSALEVNWQLYGRRTPEARAAMKFPPVNMHKLPTVTFSIIVPALREEAVIAATLKQLLAQTYPHVQIVVTLAEGDDGTIAAVRRVMQGVPESQMIMVVQKYVNGSKPKQLNAALPYCTGDYVGIIDAETLAATELVDHIWAIIDRDPSVDVIQGGVQLVNVDLAAPVSWRRFENYPYLGHLFAKFFAGLWLKVRGWFCIHNVMEYYFWFSSRMEYQAAQGFVPLGGNTVFVRSSMLRDAGGWPLNLTEDCALGVRLSVKYKAKVATAYEARLASREETPSTLRSLIKQRTRWDQGFLSVMLERQWSQLPTLHKRSMALYILGMPLIQAINGLMLPLAIVGVFLLTAPVPIVLGMFLPVIPMVMSVTIRVVGAREFSRDFGQKLRLRHYMSLVLLNPWYQMVLALPAVISLWRHARGITNWDKTDHEGAHLATSGTVPARQLATASR